MWNQRRRTSSLARRQGVRGPVLEGLEGRTLLSGTVTAALAGGNWTITGDAADNTIKFTQAGDVITLSGADGTSVAGATSITAFRGNLVVNGLGGADHVTLDAVTLSKELRFAGAAGQNALIVQGSVVRGRITTTGGSGADTVQITGSQVGGGVSIATGDGTAMVFLTDTGVAGGVTVVNGANDTCQVNLNGCTVSGAVSITSGASAGGVSVMIATVQIGGSLTVRDGSVAAGMNLTALAAHCTVAGNVTIAYGEGPAAVSTSTAIGVGGNLSVTSKGGADTVSLSDLTVYKNLSVQTGAGNDTVGMDDLTVFGTATVNTGPGADAVNIERSDSSNIPSSFHKAATFTVGHGSAVQVGVEGDSLRRAVFCGATKFDAGALDIANTLDLFNATFLGTSVLKGYYLV